MFQKSTHPMIPASAKRLHFAKWNITIFIWLVVTGTMEWIMTFHSVGNGIVIPTDELTQSFFRGLGIPPTIYIYICIIIICYNPII